MKHDFQRYEASIRDIPTHTLHLWTFEVSITLSWVVDAWNGRETWPFYFSCQVAWDFSISFQNKPCLAPHLTLSDRSMCMCPYQGIQLAFFFILLLVMAICGAQGRAWSTRHTCITYIAMSKTESKVKNKSYNQIKMCTCMDCDGWNGNSFCMISLPI